MVNKGTCSFYQWAHEQIFQGNLGSKWILGSNLEFLLEEQSKNIFGDNGNFRNLSGEHGAQTPLGASLNDILSSTAVP